MVGDREKLLLLNLFIVVPLCTWVGLFIAGVIVSMNDSVSVTAARVIPIMLFIVSVAASFAVYHTPTSPQGEN